MTSEQLNITKAKIGRLVKVRQQNGIEVIGELSDVRKANPKLKIPGYAQDCIDVRQKVDSYKPIMRNEISSHLTATIYVKNIQNLNFI